MNLQAESFHIGVKGVLVSPDLKVLTLRSKMEDGKTLWSFPGGRIHTGELIEEALLREVAEELPNLRNIKVEKIIHAIRYFDYQKNGNSMLRLFYRITADFSPTVMLTNEHDAWRWLTSHDAEALSREPNTIIDLEVFVQALKN